MGLFNRFKKSFKKHYEEISYTNYNKISYDLSKVENYKSSLDEIGSYNPWLSSSIRSIVDNSIRVNLKVRRRKDQTDIDHEILNILNQPNPYQSRNQFLKYIMFNYQLDGNGYIKIIRIGNKIKGLLPLPYHLVDVKKEGEELVYYYGSNPDIKKKERIESENIIHFKDTSFSNSYIKGSSKLLHLILSLVQSNYIDRYNTSFLENGAEPYGIYTSESNLSPKQIDDLRKQFNNKLQGVDKKGKNLILGSGLKYQKTGTDIKDLSFEKLKKITREEILSLYNVPPVLLGLTEKVNYSNAKEQRRIFWEVVLQPLLNNFIDTLNQLLENEYEFYIDYSGINELQEIMNQKELVQMGLLLGVNRKEIINKMNLPFDIDKLEEQPEKKYISKGMKKEGDNIGCICEKCGNWIEPIGNHICNKCDHVNEWFKPERIETKKIKIPERYKKSFRTIQKQNFHSFSSKLYGSFENELDKHFLEIRNDILDYLKTQEKGLKENIQEFINKKKNVYDYTLKELSLKQFIEINENLVKKMLNEYGLEYKTFTEESTILLNHTNRIIGINDTVYKNIIESINEGIINNESMGSISERVRKVFSETKKRVRTIVKTETNSLSNDFLNENYKKNGVEKKEWLSALDESVRESHLIIDGEVKNIDEPFSNGLLYPSDLSGSPEEIINCRCSVSPYIE